MTNKPIAIIGAGNGGQTTAAWLSNQGYQTRIFDVMEDTVAKLNELGGVNIYGNTDFPGFGKIQFATTDIAKAIDGCEVIFIILPEIYHVSIAQKLAPHLVDGQIVVIDPVSGLGILAFKKALAEAGCKADISLAATSTLLFAARIQTTGDVFVTGQKTELSIVAIPNSKREIIKEAIYPVFSQHHFIDNSIQLALDNLNLIFHPGPTLLYTAQIEKGEKFNYYNDMVPSQITLMKALDQERMAICAAYGVKLAQQLEPGAQVGAPYVSLDRSGAVKAQRQRLFALTIARQKARCGPDDISLVFLRGGYFRLMYASVGHKEHIAGMELMGRALDVICHRSGKKHHQLVELVIVILDLLGAVVLKMEYAEILIQISALFSRDVFHASAS